MRRTLARLRPRRRRAPLAWPGFRLLARRTGRRHDADFEAKIVAYFEHPYTNAVLKGADNVIQNVKRRARGFRNIDYFATMIYLTCGKLDLKAVTTT